MSTSTSTSLVIKQRLDEQIKQYNLLHGTSYNVEQYLYSMYPTLTQKAINTILTQYNAAVQETAPVSTGGSATLIKERLDEQLSEYNKSHGTNLTIEQYLNTMPLITDITKQTLLSKYAEASRPVEEEKGPEISGITDTQKNQLRNAGTLGELSTLQTKWNLSDTDLKTIIQGTSIGSLWEAQQTGAEVPSVVAIPITQAELDRIADAEAKGLCVGAMEAYYTVKTYRVTLKGGGVIYVEALDERTAKQKASDAGYKVAWVTVKFGELEPTTQTGVAIPMKTLTGNEIPREWLDASLQEKEALGMVKKDGVWTVDVVKFSGGQVLARTVFNTLSTEQQDVALQKGWDGMIDEFYAKAVINGEDSLIGKDTAEILRDTDIYRNTSGTDAYKLGVAYTNLVPTWESAQRDAEEFGKKLLADPSSPKILVDAWNQGMASGGLQGAVESYNKVYEKDYLPVVNSPQGFLWQRLEEQVANWNQEHGTNLSVVGYIATLRQGALETGVGITEKAGGVLISKYEAAQSAYAEAIRPFGLSDADFKTIKPYIGATGYIDADKFIKNNPDKKSIEILRKCGVDEGTIEVAKGYVEVMQDFISKANSMNPERPLPKGEGIDLLALERAFLTSNLPYTAKWEGSWDKYWDKVWRKLPESDKLNIADAYVHDMYKGKNIFVQSVATSQAIQAALPRPAQIGIKVGEAILLFTPAAPLAMTMFATEAVANVIVPLSVNEKDIKLYLDSNKNYLGTSKSIDATQSGILSAALGGIGIPSGADPLATYQGLNDADKQKVNVEFTRRQLGLERSTMDYVLAGAMVVATAFAHVSPQ